MISLSLKNFRLSLSFGFFFVLAVTTLHDNRLGALSLLFCIMHELGHLLAMHLYHISVSEVLFYGAGIKISTSGISQLSKLRQVAIYLAGPMTNLALALLIKGGCGAINLSLALFNLLPVRYFDGGRIAAVFLPERGIVIRILSFISNLILCIVTAAALYVNHNILNISSLVTLGYIALSYILDA